MRSPRDTSRAMREDRAEGLLFLAEGMATGSPASFIEAQEAAGQREMVGSDVIPTELNGCTEDDLTALGFVLGEQVPGDALFRYATLPPGWKREGSGHDMWSYILDGDGYRRCSVFYKAAFYDRAAHLGLCTLGSYVWDCLHDGTTPRIQGDWATREGVLEAIAKKRAYNQEQIDFWAERGKTSSYDYAGEIVKLDAMAKAVSGS